MYRVVTSFVTRYRTLRIHPLMGCKIAGRNISLLRQKCRSLLYSLQYKRKVRLFLLLSSSFTDIFLFNYPFPLLGPCSRHQILLLSFSVSMSVLSLVKLSHSYIKHNLRHVFVLALFLLLAIQYISFWLSHIFGLLVEVLAESYFWSEIRILFACDSLF